MSMQDKLEAARQWLRDRKQWDFKTDSPIPRGTLS